jgi:hypothetical protein
LSGAARGYSVYAAAAQPPPVAALVARQISSALGSAQASA